MCSLGSMYSYTEHEPVIPGSLAPEIEHRESRFESPLRAGLCMKIGISLRTKTQIIRVLALETIKIW